MALSDKEYLERELARRELARKSYKRYLYYVHGALWHRTRMSDYLADAVQKFVETDTGNAYDILIIKTPPQHGKSMTITESFPSWYLGKYPRNRVIEASYNDDTAKRFGRKNIEKAEQFGGSLFGMKKGSIWTTTEFELDNGWGRMISRGIMSGITGNPANLLIIDDPIKNREEADSETYRGKLWQEWQNTLKSRLAAGAKVIVIMTPWHEDDLCARLAAREENVTEIRLPVEAEELDLLGRPVGDALCPELGKDNAWLAQFKASYITDPKEGGLRAWQALYQCSPRVEGGNVVKREWWKYYDPKDITAFGTTVISVDATFKDKESNDFVAIEVWSKRGAFYYLRYCLKRHMDFPATVQAIRTVRMLFPETMYTLIEDKANGSAIIQTLRHEFPGVIAINPKGGKVARVNAVSPAIESGNVLLPENELWTEDFVDEFTAFPAGQHDDMCFAAGTPIATARGDVPIESVRVGDKVWTPFGLREVRWAGQTGVSEVVTRCGLTGTPSHPVYDDRFGYNELQSLTGCIHCDTLSLKGVIRWTYRRLLCSMVSNIDSWEPENIISVSRVQMKGDAMLKDFMWRSGSFIRARQFLPAMRFITKTATLSITTTATWSAYRAQNIGQCIKQRIKSGLTLMKSVRLPLSGTGAKKGKSGTGSMVERRWRNESDTTAFANSAERCSKRCTSIPAFAATTAQLSGSTRTRRQRFIAFASGAVKRLMQKFRQENPRLALALAPAGLSYAPKSRGNESIMARSYERPARSAARSLRQNVGTQPPRGVSAVARATQCSGVSGRRNSSNKVPVYNLTVQGCHLYYAGGILVHNCDAASQALSFMLFSHGGDFGPPAEDRRQLAERTAVAEEQNIFLSNEMYDPYGRMDFEVI